MAHEMIRNEGKKKRTSDTSQNAKKNKGKHL